MVKFWKRDVCYIKRDVVSFYPNWYRYAFRVRSDTENYLIRKYGLSYNNTFLSVIYECDNQDITIYIISRSGDNQNSETVDCEADDYEELRNIVKEFIKDDLVNYEEYVCDADYYEPDSRWSDVNEIRGELNGRN